ncbi:MAG: DinB family protein [Candidatus Dormibacteraceae bacterium]
MNRAPIDRMRSSLDELTALVPRLPPEAMARADGPGEWTTAQIVSHLADAELAHGFRIRLVLTQDRPRLAGYDQEAWVRRLSAADDAQSALSRWRALRQSNMRLLESLRESEWQRAGHHEERGEITIAQIAEQMAGHDEAHLDQLRRSAGI